MSDKTLHNLSADYDRIRKAIAFLHANTRDQPTLEAVAETVGLSPAHFQRMFRRWAGISPKRFLQHLSANDAKRLLRESTAVLDTAFAVGLSGPGRLHDLIVAVDAMTPGEYARFGAGTTIRYGWSESPFGMCFLGTTDRGVCSLRFVDDGDLQSQIDSLTDEWPGATLLEQQKEIDRLAKTIFQDGRRTDHLLNVKGTNFQLNVWEGLLRLPPSSVVSYSDLATRLGCPKATRAVASAVAANPVGYLIPCHRVIRSTGGLGGYRWGIERKACMLARESASPALT